MQVRVFEAADMRSALEKVKKTLGPEALILSTRSLDKGEGGLDGRSGIEVTAAVDTDLHTEPGPDVRGKTFGQYLDRQAARSAAPGGARDPDSGLVEEFRRMKRSFQELARELSWIRHRGGEAGEVPAGGGIRIAGLSALGIGTRALELASGTTLPGEEGPAAGTGPEDLDAFLASFIADHVKIRNPLAGPFSGQKRLVFIGPTGVGKTTTIAKVAANYMLEYGKKVALATIDNYRIAAVEQLKIYGQIMNVPVEVARNEAQLPGIFSRHADKNLVLVDTAGRSPKDEAHQRELARFLDPALQTENCLVLSVTTREADLYRAIDRFGHVKLHGLVLTKLDECDLLGQILNVGIEADCPLSFLTNGQKVPEDLILPEPRKIARMILKPDGAVAKWSTGCAQTRPEPCVN